LVINPSFYTDYQQHTHLFHDDVCGKEYIRNGFIRFGMTKIFDSIPPQSAPEYTRPPDERFVEAGDEEFRRRQVINHIVTSRLIDRITGRGEDQSTLYGVDPRVRYFAATLANQFDYREDQETDDEGKKVEAAESTMTRNISPFTTGLKIKVDPKNLDGPLKIIPAAKFFFKRLPEFEEQLEHVDLAATTKSEEETSDPQTEIKADGGAAQSNVSEPQPLVSVYERISPDFEPVEISEAQLRNKCNGGGEITEPISSGIKSAKSEFESHERAFKQPEEGASYNDWQNVPPEALESESAFESHLDSVFSESLQDPLWEAEIRAKVAREEDGCYELTVQLVNTQGEDPETATEPNEAWQSYLFDASLTISAPSPAFEPFASDKIRDHYQYDGDIYGIGRNCSAKVEDRDPVTEIKTDPVPVYRQPKYVSRDTIPAPTKRLADGEFEEVLGNIETEMDHARKQYKSVRDTVLAGKGESAAKEYDQMLEQFEQERDRFKRGKELLLDPDNDDLRTAFRALNETFAKEFEDWRLFQIVFIVMSIPDIGSQVGHTPDVTDMLDQCDIIFFPTGGGKTEAYLGLVTFTAFLDRLRGKDYGMTGLTKFPLRLLSLQQLQRIANVLCLAEEVRREHDDMGGERFSIGYFVGDRNTPNDIFEESGGVNNVRKAAENEEFAQQLLTVPTCPYCREKSVVVTGDLDRLRIIHQCTNSECSEVIRQGGDTAELPIYVTDNEIYRYTPTFVVSTIDKIAVVGMNRRARGLLGQLKYRCPEHGFTPERQCLLSGHGVAEEHRCENDTPDKLQSIEPVDPPSLLIQDELHLLREEFGAFDSHYETFMQMLISEYTDDEWDMKTVAATATIKGANQQVDALYRKEPNEFPSQGPHLRQSFYAYEDPYRLGRQMIGALPRSIGRTRAINIVIREYARVTQFLESNPDKLYEEMQDVTEDVVAGPLELPQNKEARRAAVLAALDDYKVQISYNISKNQSDILQRSIKGMVNRQLDAYGEPHERLTPVSLTGETEMEEVRNALSRLQTANAEEPIDVVIATSMISHGVDVDRFNFISFFGMPRNTAEYIQAYSRVGRDSTGTVFVLFDSIKARDRSHYTRFEHYHRYQDLLVEATPLERWAEFAIECTLPGIFLGILIQYYDHHFEDEFEKRVYNLDGFRDALDQGVITYDKLLRQVLDAYDVREVDRMDGDQSIGARLYYDSIEEQFEKLWNRLLSADPQIRDPRKAGLKKYLGNVMEDEDEGLRGPMRSLRDIDEQIPVMHGLATQDLKEMFGESR